MKANKWMLMQLYFASFIIVLWGALFIGVLRSSMEEKILTLCLFVVYMLLDGFIVHTLSKDLHAKQTHKGKVLKEYNMILPLVCLSISIFFTLYFTWELYMGTARFSQIACGFILSSNALALLNSPLIMIEDTGVFFHHRWIPYDDISKIDTDKSIRKYVIVMIYANKTYRERIDVKSYTSFEQELKQHGIDIL